MTRLRHAIEAAAFAVLLRLALVAPRRLLLALGGLAGRLGYHVDRRHRRVGLQNLSAAFGPELRPADARRLLRRCWIHFGRITLDTLRFPELSALDLHVLVRYRGLEHIRSAYARGKGVLLFSGHFGHWELIAYMQGFLGLPLSLVARPLDNPRLERSLAELRCGSGNRVIHKRTAVREMLKALRAGRGIAIVLDQDARHEGLFVPFFGRPASTTPTLALVALRTGAAVVPTYSVPREDGGYDVIYEREIEVHPTGDRDADIRRITAECTARIEEWVRSHPEHWLWMHRRWKTQP